MRARSGKKKSRLESWVKSAATPVFLVSAGRRVLFFNAGCEQLTGWTADDIVGEICEFHSDSEPQALRALTNSLCPPPEVLAGFEQDVPTYVPNKQGAPAARLVKFVPLRDTSERVTSVLGIVSPIPSPPVAQAPSLALRYHAELSALRWTLRQRYGLKSVIARAPVMQRVLEQIQVARHSSVPIHLTGPRGSGKEHLARAIHQEGETQQGSFVPFDCRQSPLSLLQTLQRLLHPDADDSGLGALQSRTLFLIDVAHLPRDVQERLLAEYRPDGERVSRRLPLPRLMSSSTERLTDAVEDERLLQDLFYLLTTLLIEVPSLRSRGDDLMPLAQAFLESLNRGASRQVTGFADDVWPQLREYQWPGNLDELALVVQEARELSTGPVIEVKHLPLRFRAGLEALSVGPGSRAADDPLPPLESHLAQIERELIERALTQAKQNKTLAAKLLGLQRPVLYRRMQALKMIERGEPEQTGA